MLTRARSAFDAETERQIEAVIDAALAVHRALGPGFIERIYHNALSLELSLRGIPFETEKTVVISYRQRIVGVHRLDLIVRDAILVEIKASKNLEPSYQAQLLSYLKATNCRIGLLMNFGGSTLAQGLRRIVL